MNKNQQTSAPCSQSDDAHGTKADVACSQNEKVMQAAQSESNPLLTQNSHDLTTAPGFTPDCERTGNARFFTSSQLPSR